MIVYPTSKVFNTNKLVNYRSSMARCSATHADPTMYIFEESDSSNAFPYEQLWTGVMERPTLRMSS